MQARIWSVRTWLVAQVAAAAVVAAGAVAANAQAPARNVIVLVADGTGATHTTVARWVKGAPLALDGMLIAAVRTYSADSLMTDSAPAATAFACGFKSQDDFVGVLPERVVMPGVPATPPGLEGAPVASVLEAAALAGKSTGIVATSNVQHATPAAFTAHWPRRGDYGEIAEQQVYRGLDVVLGGGLQWLTTPDGGGRRTDGEDLVAVLRGRGVEVVRTRDELLAARAPRVWGLFAGDALASELDRREMVPEQPSLAEMTRRAIELLARNPNGFFLMVEGSKVDWASHANDPVGVVGEVLAFDAAVEAALEFARGAGDTLVLAFSDHGNAGMSIGNRATDRSYATTSIEELVRPLRRARLTAEGVERRLGADRDEARLRAVLAADYAIDDPTTEELHALAAAPPGRLGNLLGPMLSRRATIGWTTSGHTGEDLFLYHWGVGAPLGLLENTEIARLVARAMGVDLEVATRRLFVPADEAFTAGAYRIDRRDYANPVLVIDRGDVRAELPLATDRLLIHRGEDVEELFLEGVVIESPVSGRVFLPREAVTAITGQPAGARASAHKP
jgi:alkaline phosphatase